MNKIIVWAVKTFRNNAIGTFTTNRYRLHILKVNEKEKIIHVISIKVYSELSNI